MSTVLMVLLKNARVAFDIDRRQPADRRGRALPEQRGIGGLRLEAVGKDSFMVCAEVRFAGRGTSVAVQIRRIAVAVGAEAEQRRVPGQIKIAIAALVGEYFSGESCHLWKARIWLTSIFETVLEDIVVQVELGRILNAALRTVGKAGRLLRPNAQVIWLVCQWLRDRALPAAADLRHRAEWRERQTIGGK